MLYTDYKSWHHGTVRYYVTGNYKVYFVQSTKYTSNNPVLNYSTVYFIFKVYPLCKSVEVLIFLYTYIYRYICMYIYIYIYFKSYTKVTCDHFLSKTKKKKLGPLRIFLENRFF